MAIRVLGYKSVVESKGTWPTNYIAKASELKALKDVDYKTYSDGATRGNVAILVWNVLRAPMWDVDSESEKDGLNYSKKGTMIDKYFDDYTYATVTFEARRDEDGKVKITLDDGTTGTEEKILENTEYEYEGTDFYTFVKGTEVEVLVNEDDKTLLTIVPSGKDTLKEGTKVDLDDDYTTLHETDYDYAFGIIKGKEIKAYTLLDIDSEYIYEAKTQKSSVKLNKKTYTDDKYEDTIAIVDGNRASLRDVKEGMTLSKVTVDNIEFYIAVSNNVTGKFTKYVEKKDENSNKYNVLTINGEEYIDGGATYVEDPEDSKEKQDKKLSSTDFAKYDMKNEVVTAYLDFIGRVTRLDFDGSIGDETSSDVKFFAATSEVDREKKGVYTISLEDTNGSDDYYFEKDSKIAKKFYDDDTIILDGSFVAVKFNDDNEIVELIKIARAKSGEQEITDETHITYDAEDPDGEFVFEKLDKASYDEDKEKIGSYLVDDDTIIVTVTFDDNGTRRVEKDDKSVVKFEEGLKAAKNVDDETVILIYDKAEKVTYVKYVVRFDDAVSTSGTLTGKVEAVKYNKLDKEYVLTIDGNDYLYNESDNDGVNIEDYVDGVIVFTLKENKDNEEYVQFKSGTTREVFKDMILNDRSGDQTSDYVDDYVDEVAKRIVSFVNSGDMSVTAKEFQDDFKGYVFVPVEIHGEIAKNEQDVEEIITDDDEIVVSVKDAIDVEEITVADFTVGDRIRIDGEEKVMYIISGMDERE